MSPKEHSKKDQRNKIQSLYLSGLSISEVAHKMDFSSSGIVYHLKQSKVLMRKRSDAVLLKHHARLDSFSASLPKIIPKELHNLYLISLALYWGEGSKTGNTIAITNSDPQIILTFLSFLRKICVIDENRLHILIHYYSDQNEKDLITYWSRLTNIKKSQFYKSTLHGNKARNKARKSTNRLEFGTISLRYADSLLHKELLERIQSLKCIHKAF